ncbi:MAG: collagen-like protein, partial [Gammaproteobacteria bacterium]|nr:collagen-like protein [Gammaproteobacteria bacterium]
MARFRLDTQWRCLLLCSILIMPVTTFAQRPSLTGINSRVLTLEEQDRSEGTQLVIESAVIAGTAIEIRGVNFDTGGEPEVLLGGLPVSVTSFGPYDVQVSLDAPLVAGSYALTVQTGPSRSQFDAFTITMGSTGPQGEPGPMGPRGFQGPAGIAGLRVLRTSTTVGP